MRLALCQLNSSDTPADNLPATLGNVRDAVAQGAEFVLTPEVTNCVSTSRKHQKLVLQFESDDLTLAALREEARAAGVWILIGSLAIKLLDDDRFSNRSFLIDPAGEIVGRYDKIHMFDAEISPTEIYRESVGYRPGDAAVIAETDFGKIGLSVCYDVRFPHLYRALAKAGAKLITVPSAFSVVSGAAHWHTLLRARAIETGCFILAPAQCGDHVQSNRSKRKSYGHSLVVSPWGEVISDSGIEPRVTVLDIDLGEVDAARRKIPSLKNDRVFTNPE